MKLGRGITEQGFTIVEILVAMAISGVIATAIFTTYQSQQKSYDTTEDVSAIQQNIRAATYFMIRDIRMAGYDPLGTGNFTITNISADSITFTVDTEDPPDGNIGASETMTYSHNGDNNTIDMTRGGSTEPIAQDITSLSFTYLKADGNPAATGREVKSVEITLSAEQGGHNREITFRVLCRNMGL